MDGQRYDQYPRVCNILYRSGVASDSRAKQYNEKHVRAKIGKKIAL